MSYITQIQLSTNSHLWVIDWKPHIEIFPRQPPCIYTIWPTRGEKLQQLHCYHPFSDSRDTYLTKTHYENYSPKMVPTNPTGSWTIKYINILNTLRPRQNGRHFADDIFKCIFLNENVWIPIEISLKFVPKGHYLNQWWLVYWRIYASFGLNELIIGLYMIKQKRCFL